MNEKWRRECRLPIRKGLRPSAQGWRASAYLGIRAGKPDVHVRRILSEKRLAYCTGDPSEEQAYRLVAQLARGASCNPTYLDNLLCLFCAQDYGNVCGAQPKCSLCALSTSC